MPAKAQLICKTCQTPFYCSPSAVAAGRRYCSLKCRSADRFGKDVPVLNRTPVHFTCKECGSDFIMMQSYLNAYIKKYGRDPLYCSIACSASGRKRDKDAAHTFVCAQCGVTHQKRRKPGGRTYEQQRFCSNECKSAFQRERAATRFEAGEIGRHVKRHGYVWLSIPALLSNTGKKREILEHRWVMEQFLGRQLFPDETVHHINGDRADNRLSNLRLFASNHGPGQEVEEILDWCAETFEKYPQFLTPELYARLRRITDGEHTGHTD